MGELQNSIDELYETIVIHRGETLDDDIITGISEDISGIRRAHYKEINALTDKFEKYLDEIQQYKIQLKKEEDLGNRIDRIWKGKILMRQLLNNKFHTLAKKRETDLNKISNQLLETKILEKKLKLNRINILTDHIGAKFAFAIICEEIIDSNISPEICYEYIKYNDMMHPESKPFEKVKNDLEIFEKIVHSLNSDEQTKYDVEPNMVTKEILFFSKIN